MRLTTSSPFLLNVLEQSSMVTRLTAFIFLANFLCIVYADCKNQIHEIDFELVRKPFDSKRENKAKMYVLFYLLRKINKFKLRQMMKAILDT